MPTAPLLRSLRPLTVTTRTLLRPNRSVLHSHHSRLYSSPKPPPPNSLSGPSPEKHTSSGNHYTRPAEDLSHAVTPAEKKHYDKTLQANFESQVRKPWLRAGADVPPVEKLKGVEGAEVSGGEGRGDGSAGPTIQDERGEGDVTRGRLLTTPSRMLKLIVPLTSAAVRSRELKSMRGKGDGEGQKTEKSKGIKAEVEPLALLVHPQQPLSYLERLIQSELPLVKDDDGKERVPQVWFRAEEAMRGEEEVPESEREAAEEVEGDGGVEKSGETKGNGKKDGKAVKGDEEEQHEEDFKEGDTMIIDGKAVKTGKLNSSSSSSKKPEPKTSTEPEKSDHLSTSATKAAHTDTPSPSSPSPEPETDKTGMPTTFVRWSSSTEIGDFIRDAARTRFFALEIENAPSPILVGVPSFHDRTYYLRMRLRQKTGEMAELADLKQQCDSLAERGAKRVAGAGGAALVGYWWVVYLLTFRTELGWEVMEPVTYLVGLSTLIGGYAWFLFHNRQISYRSAMNFTISRRQSKLYEQKGFDLRRWEDLVEEGNKLRREIKLIAEEYDVHWNEKEDAKNEKVVEELRKEREKQKSKKKKDDDDDDD